MNDRSRTWAIAVAAAALAMGVAWFGLQAAEPAHPAAAAPVHAPAVPPLQDADTIHDDPTVAPDPKQSADKDVSLPADI